MHRSFLGLAAATVMLAGCATVGAPIAADMTPADRAGYVTVASASDLFEIQSSQLALSKAQRPEIRQFAQMLVDHHTQTTATLTAAARASGLNPPPPMLLPMQQRMIQELQRAPAGSFDQVYARQQVPAHEMALALHRNYSTRGDTPQLRTAAAAAVPIVQQHLDRARQLD
jgi:putative membrane protein